MGTKGLVATLETISYRVLFGSLEPTLGRLVWPLMYLVFHTHVPTTFSKTI
jgi:hypothetical protein